MKKLMYLPVIILTFAIVFASRQNIQSFVTSLKPCDKPITYHIGDIDSRFNLKQNQVFQYAKEASDIWNNQRQRPLFVYSDSGQITINMVYDLRQGQSNKINELDSGLNDEKRQLDSQVAAHRSKVADFKKRLQEYNFRVEAINAQGGASQEQYVELIKVQEALSNEANQINEEAKILNISSEDFNVGVTKLNSEIQKFNQELVLKPEEGIYIASENRIEIYFNNNKNDLVHTMAHEFGHALGIDHVQGPEAIMYAFTTNVTSLSPDDIAQLEQVCSERSAFEGISEKIQLITSYGK